MTTRTPTIHGDSIILYNAIEFQYHFSDPLLDQGLMRCVFARLDHRRIAMLRWAGIGRLPVDSKP